MRFGTPVRNGSSKKDIMTGPKKIISPRLSLPGVRCPDFIVARRAVVNILIKKQKEDTA